RTIYISTLSLHDALPILLAGSRAAERQTLWQMYKGKTIIMLGNQFPYFDRGQRTAMNLIDPKDSSPAVFGGTSIFVSGMSVDQRSEEHTSELQSLRHLVC